MDQLSQLLVNACFGCSSSPAGDTEAQLRDLVAVKLASIKVMQHEPADRDCLVARIGDFMVQASALTAELAAALADGKHINDRIDETIIEMHQRNDFTDLLPLNALDERHRLLKEVARRLNSEAAAIRSIWTAGVPDVDNVGSSPARASVSLGPAAPSPSSSNLSTTTPTAAAAAAAATAAAAAATATSAADMDAAVRRELEQLGKPRARGRWTCPHGDTCNKGGLDDHGQMVVFEQQSIYRIHLEKHIRRYRCQLPGCPNREGFHRKDQLQRHQHNVTHRSIS